MNRRALPAARTTTLNDRSWLETGPVGLEPEAGRAAGRCDSTRADRTETADTFADCYRFSDVTIDYGSFTRSRQASTVIDVLDPDRLYDA
jgi:hypothetical protein